MKELSAFAQKLTGFLRRYVVVLAIVLFGAMYGYLIYTSGKQAEQQPSDAQISEKFQGVSRPKLDESVAKQLQELEYQNIEVKTLFDNARNNPFSE